MNGSKVVAKTAMVRPGAAPNRMKPGLASLSLYDKTVSKFNMLLTSARSAEASRSYLYPQPCALSP
jgi:hypothetical protein